MDMDVWRQNANERLEALTGTMRQMTPGVLYGALCASTLLPVITAASSDPIGAYTALGGLLGNVGGNLIANQIQEWKDRTEPELAAELAEKAESSEEWRDALDALLAEFQAPQVVQAILSEADRDWFAETLQAGIEQVGSGLTVNNEGVWVVGDRNFVGNATNSIVQLGDNATATYLGQRGDAHHSVGHLPSAA